MILEMSKTEFVVPESTLVKTTPLTIEISSKESAIIKPQHRVKWLGFNLEYTRISFLVLNLGSLTKLFVYVSELVPHVDADTFKTIFRTYVQASLNYFYIPAKYLGGSSFTAFVSWEAKLRSIQDVSTMPETAVICQNQLHKLNQAYPRTEYNLR